MAQRKFTLTGTATDFGGNVLGNAPCSFQPILPGVTGAMIDGLGEFVSMAPVPFRTNPDGTFPALTVDYPPDFQTAYQAAQVRVTVNGIVTDSPIGFGYAASIDVTAWINATVATGLVTMRAVYTRDNGDPIPGATGSVALSDSAIVTATGQFRSSNDPVQSNAATDGTMLFSVDPNSALNPADLGYSFSIAGESRQYAFTVPTVVDVYRGAWNVGTTYHGASGASNGDVVVDSGTLYRYINATPSAGHATSDATRWLALAADELPTDLIAAHITSIGPSNGTTIGTIGVRPSANFTPLSGDPHMAPASLDDQLVNMTAETRARLRYLGAWSSATAYVANDVVLSGGVGYISILAGTNHTPPNATYWVALPGSGGSSSVITTQGDLEVGDSSGAAARLPLGTAHQVLSPVGSDAAWVTPMPLAGATDPSTAEGDTLYRKATLKSSMVIGFIGDSITLGNAGPGISPTEPQSCATALTTASVTVTSINAAVSGTATGDWLPGSTNYTTAVASFDSAGVRLVHVMLGTNDATGVSAATYRANLRQIVNGLVGHGYLVALSYPPYVFDGVRSDALLLAYQLGINSLANNTTVFLGDSTAHSDFQAHQATWYQAGGLHPNQTGANAQGVLWANALAPIVHALSEQTTLQRLPIGSSGQVLTVAGGYPAWQNPSGGGGFTNPLTTQDDLFVGGVSGAPARLGKGAAGQVLTTNPSTGHVDWENSASGFSNPMTTPQDLIVGGTAGAAGRLGIGSNGQNVQVVAGVVTWANPLIHEPVVLSVTAGVPDFLTLGGDIVML